MRVRDSRRRDDYIDAAEVLHHLRDHRIDLRLVARIDLVRDRLAPEFFY
jgi:hypothetical protein